MRTVIQLLALTTLIFINTSCEKEVIEPEYQGSTLKVTVSPIGGDYSEIVSSVKYVNMAGETIYLNTGNTMDSTLNTETSLIIQGVNKDKSITVTMRVLKYDNGINLSNGGIDTFPADYSIHLDKRVFVDVNSVGLNFNLN